MAKRFVNSLVLFLLVTGTATGLAQANSPAGQAPAAAAGAVEPTAATVRKVDLAAGKVTLAHGPLKNLGMPAMTMTFKVTDPALLAQLKAGDKITFVAEMAGRDYLATRIVPAK